MLELAVVDDLDQYREQFQAWQKPKIKKSLDLALMIKVNPEREATRHSFSGFGHSFESLNPTQF